MWRHDMKGTHQTLLKKLQCDDMKHYIKYLRMEDDTFEFIVSIFFFFSNKVLINETI
jgi:hypothetical protein